MDEFTHLDWKGRPITTRQWWERKQAGGARVALTRAGLGRGLVSTVWLGLDHNWWAGGPPLIFETMIFGGPLDGELWRYSTPEQARAGHRRVVRLVLGLSRGRQLLHNGSKPRRR